MQAWRRNRLPRCRLCATWLVAQAHMTVVARSFDTNACGTPTDCAAPAHVTASPLTQSWTRCSLRLTSRHRRCDGGTQHIGHPCPQSNGLAGDKKKYGETRSRTSAGTSRNAVLPLYYLPWWSKQIDAYMKQPPVAIIYKKKRRVTGSRTPISISIRRYTSHCTTTPGFLDPLCVFSTKHNGCQENSCNYIWTPRLRHNNAPWTPFCFLAMSSE